MKNTIMNSPKVNKRILALDILRGFTIAGMILVNKGNTQFFVTKVLACIECANASRR